jgi:hypothetical protein
MNPTTESESQQQTHSPEFSSGFLATMLALTGATLVIVFLFAHGYVQQHATFGTQREFRGLFSTMAPWVVAGGLTIERGLTEFSGNTPQVLQLSTRLALAFGVCLSLVIGPTLYFFSMRRRFTHPKPPGTGLQSISVSYVIGGILTFSLAFVAVPAAVIQRVVDHNLRSAQAVQEDRDIIIGDLNTIAWHAYQYHVLPARLHGGAGSYANFVANEWIPQSAAGTYRCVEITPNWISLEAQAIHYPGSSVSVKLDSLGRLGYWSYTGDFK